MGEALGELPCPAYRGFWCDGVLMNQTESHYSKKYINDKRKARFRAWIGKNGQSLYDLYLTFGPKALSRYARGLDISGCMPGSGTGFYIDPENQVIIVELS